MKAASNIVSQKSCQRGLFVREYEYCLQVPANRIGFEGNGGPFSIMQLKILQEVITLVVFIIFSAIAFHMQIKWNHIMAGICLVAAVYFVFGFK